MSTSWDHVEARLPGENGCGCSAPPAPRARLRLALLPALVVAVLPKCPLCVAAYLGAFGSIAPGSWIAVAWGAPLTGACLLVAVGALAVRARRRRGVRPLVLGVVGAAALFAGKFLLASWPGLVPLGAALLVFASAWSTWAPPDRARPGRAAPEP